MKGDPFSFLLSHGTFPRRKYIFLQNWKDKIIFVINHHHYHQSVTTVDCWLQPPRSSPSVIHHHHGCRQCPPPPTITGHYHCHQTATATTVVAATTILSRVFLKKYIIFSGMLVLTKYRNSWFLSIICNIPRNSFCIPNVPKCRALKSYS